MQAPIIDGNTYPLAVRLHDNRFANSPRAVYHDGVYRSDLLALGEQGFDPVRKILSVGIGAAKGLSIVSGDFNGNLIIDHTPIIDEHGHKISQSGLHDSTGGYALQVGFNAVSIKHSVILQNDVGVDTVKLGHGHALAATATLFNLPKVLKRIIAYREEVDDAILTESELEDLESQALSLVNSMFTFKQQDPRFLPHNFPEVFGNYANELTSPEILSASPWAADAYIEITDDYALSPNGLRTATLLFDAHDDQVSALTQEFAVDEDTAYRTASVCLSKNTARFSCVRIRYSLGGVTQSEAYATWDWELMSLVTDKSSGKIGVLATDVPDWYRLYAAVENNGSADTCSITIYPSGSHNDLLSEMGGVLAWGAMVNPGNVPDFYVAD